jgi:hypothetical protein
MHRDKTQPGGSHLRRSTMTCRGVTAEYGPAPSPLRYADALGALTRYDAHAPVAEDRLGARARSEANWARTPDREDARLRGGQVPPRGPASGDAPSERAQARHPRPRPCLHQRSCGHIADTSARSARSPSYGSREPQVPAPTERFLFVSRGSLAAVFGRVDSARDVTG